MTATAFNERRDQDAENWQNLAEQSVEYCVVSVAEPDKPEV